MALSRRARYLSLHTFRLHHFQKRGGQLSDFIRKVELDYALAVRMCDRPACGRDADAVTGTIKSNQLLARGSDTFPRDFSVESNFGGYGLYYRTPLIELGLVARKERPGARRRSSSMTGSAAIQPANSQRLSVRGSKAPSTQ